jgi:nudix-type nucleoside diphosphatase (YffH/AdpP family)
VTDIRNMKVTIHGVQTAYDGFFKIIKLDTEHDRYGGDDPIRNEWEVFERGDSVGVVLYRKDTQEVVLVRQYRAPTLRYDGRRALNDGQLDETIAGRYVPGKRESHAECAAREVHEETGYQVSPERLVPISQFYVSPGGTSERIYLYYAEVTEADRDPSAKGNVAGNSSEKESTLVLHVPVSKFLADVLNPKVILDSKVLVASLLLRELLREKVPTAENQAAEPSRTDFDVKDRNGYRIVLRTGDIRSIKDVDAWINSENTDMEMDRFVGRTVSAVIRYEGAETDPKTGRVVDDIIADALRRAMRGRFTSHIGTVHETTAGELKRKNNVKRVFHVAAVRGIATKGLQTNPADIEVVTRRALEAVDRYNGMFSRCNSALLPLVGTGDGDITVDVAFPEIVKGVLSFFDNNRKTKISEVHLCAYSRYDADFAASHLARHSSLTRKA